jgi:hypothetical protein
MLVPQSPSWKPPEVKADAVLSLRNNLLHHPLILLSSPEVIQNHFFIGRIAFIQFLPSPSGYSSTKHSFFLYVQPQSPLKSLLPQRKLFGLHLHLISPFLSQVSRPTFENVAYSPFPLFSFMAT